MTTLALLGALVGLLGGIGVVLVAGSLVPVRPTLADRVLPFVPEVAWRLRHQSPAALGAAREARAARSQGAGSRTAARLRRSRSGLSLTDYRIEQLLWGGTALAAVMVVWFLAGGDVLERPGQLAVLSLGGLVAGALARAAVLLLRTRRVEHRALQELSDVTEMLSLAVEAGRALADALRHVVASVPGDLSADLGEALVASADGVPLARALDALAREADDPRGAELLTAVAVALDRGTPVAEVLRLQLAQLREARAHESLTRQRRRAWSVLAAALLVNAGMTLLVLQWAGWIDLGSLI